MKLRLRCDQLAKGFQDLPDRFGDPFLKSFEGALLFHTFMVGARVSNVNLDVRKMHAFQTLVPDPLRKRGPPARVR